MRFAGGSPTLRNPSTVVAECCARAAPGGASTVAPSKAMKLRRLISIPSAPSTASPTGSGQRMHPADHARAGVLDILLAEEILRLDAVDRIDRAEKIALV